MKFISGLALLLTVVFLAAWSPLETSNESIIRLSINDQDFCSGAVVSKSKKNFSYVATAAHCAAGTAQSVLVKTELPNGETQSKYIKTFPQIEIKQDRVDSEGNVYLSVSSVAYFVRYDLVYDVAIYKIASTPGLFKPVKLSTTKVHYGDKVYSMGMPLALWGTIADGIISKPKLGNVQGIPDFIPRDAIVHTAFMKPGSSGGALLNDQGELIGLTNWSGPNGGPNLATRVSHVIDLLKVISNENK